MKTKPGGISAEPLERLHHRGPAALGDRGFRDIGRLARAWAPFPPIKPAGRNGAVRALGPRLRGVFLDVVRGHGAVFAGQATELDMATLLALALIRLEGIFGLECGGLALSGLEAPPYLGGESAIMALSSFTALAAVCAAGSGKPQGAAFAVRITRSARGGTLLALGRDRSVGCGPESGGHGLLALFSQRLAALGGMVVPDRSRGCLFRAILPPSG